MTTVEDNPTGLVGEASPIPQHERPGLQRFDIARTYATAVGKRLGACVLAVGAITAPIAADYAVEHAQVETSIAEFPAAVTFTGNGVSSVRAGVINAYVPKTAYGLGMNATVERAPTSISSLVSSRELKTLTGFSGSLDDTVGSLQHKLEQDAVAKFIGDWGAMSLYGGLGLYTAVSLLGGENARSRREKMVASIGLVSMMTALTGAVAYEHLQDWSNNQILPPAANRIPLEKLSGTKLAGAYTDSPVSQFALEKAYDKVMALVQQQNLNNEQFITTMDDSLKEQIPNIAAPRTDEQEIVMLSDVHSNRIAMRFLGEVIAANKQRNDKDVISFGLSLGDNQYSSKTPLEYDSEKTQRQAFGDTPEAGIKGNHDVLPMPSKTIDVIKDKVKTIGGLKVLGMNDVEQTPFGQPNYFKKGWTEAKLGETARKIADKEKPDIFITHEGTAVGAFAGIDNMRAYMHSESAIDASDMPTDLPVHLLAYGHWHQEITPKVVNNSDGTWSVIIELGTAGGAIGDSQLNNFSLPNSAPLRVASFFDVFLNKQSHLVTGYQRVRLYPSGEVEIAPRVNVGSVDGQPYSISSAKRGIQLSKKRADAKARTIIKR